MSYELKAGGFLSDLNRNTLFVTDTLAIISHALDKKGVLFK